MFGYFVLYTWPIVAFAFFRSWSPAVALLVTIIGGYLLLPPQLSLDLPGLPSLNKHTIPAISALAIVTLVSSVRTNEYPQGWIPRSKLAKCLIVLLLGSAFFTVMTNSDPLTYGPVTLPGLRSWDAFSAILTALMMLLPLILGRRLLAHPDQQRQVLVALTIAGAAYSIPALIEVRMSPQLNSMVYGFFAHAWDQHIRGDGFRPIVFLSHGLWLSMFFSSMTLAAFGLARLSRGRQRVFFFGVGIWLALTLVLSKSLGALVIMLMLMPIVLFLRLRTQMLIAAGLAATVLVYPMLRGADLIPVDRVVEWAGRISHYRAESLSFRVLNEDLLLEKAFTRPFFGLGGWGRNFVFNDEGQDISVVDGYWVLIIGQGGWLRYLAEFGLLCIPALLAAWNARRYGLGMETSILILILTGNLIDLIPNATITPLTWLIAGSIWGRLELGRVAADQPSAEGDRTSSRYRSRYTRQITNYERKTGAER